MRFHSLQIHVRKQAAGTYSDGLLALQHDLLQLCRESAVRLSHHALEVLYHRLGIGQVAALGQDVILVQTVFQHKDGEIAHCLGGRGYLHDVAQQVVGLFVQALDLLEAVASAHGLYLCQQV